MATAPQTKTALPVVDADGASKNLASRLLDAQNILYMEPLRHGVTQERFIRYLDTVGDGSGTKNAAANHASAQEEYKLEPASGDIYRVERLRVLVVDNATFQSEYYGAFDNSSGNGVEVHIKDGTGSLVDLTDSVPIKANYQWACLGEIGYPTMAIAGYYQLQVDIRFDLMGVPVRLDGDSGGGEYLSVDLNDNFSTLIAHYFVAHGFVE